MNTGYTLKVGDVFSTDVESGCVVTSVDDIPVNGHFLALAPDGVECYYSLAMVKIVTE